MSLSPNASHCPAVFTTVCVSLEPCRKSSVSAAVALYHVVNRFALVMLHASQLDSDKKGSTGQLAHTEGLNFNVCGSRHDSL